jgi:hypothetical protein
LIVRRWNGLKKRHAAHIVRICCAYAAHAVCTSQRHLRVAISITSDGGASRNFVVAHHSPIDTCIILYSTCKTEGVKLSEAVWSYQLVKSGQSWKTLAGGIASQPVGCRRVGAAVTAWQGMWPSVTKWAM